MPRNKKAISAGSMCSGCGERAGVGQFLKKTCEEVKIDAVKLAEDGDGFVLHMHESTGGKACVDAIESGCDQGKRLVICWFAKGNQIIR